MRSRRAIVVRSSLTLLVALASIPLGSFHAASDVPPVTFTVTSTADAPDAVPGDGICASAAATCTLRAAVDESTATGMATEVALPAGHYVVGSPLQVAAGTLWIRGADRATTTIDAGGTGRAFDVFGGAALGLQKLTVAKGATTQEGGAIRAVDAALTLDTAAVATSSTDGYGGGVFAAGSTVTITGSVFDHDTALAGGAVAVMGGDLAVTGSTFTNDLATDVGGAVAVFGARTLTIAATTFAANVAEHSGGAVFLSGAGTAPYTVTGSTFTGNQSFGGEGGAIATDGLVAAGNDGALAVMQCTFTGNQADRDGGAIAAATAITSIGNTFAGNAAPENADVAMPVPADLCRDAGLCKDTTLDAFRCYQAKPTKGAPVFAPVVGVRLANAFADLTADLKSRTLLCAPTATGAADVLDATTDLAGYTLTPEKGQPKQVPQTAVKLTSQLGSLVVDTAKPDLLLLPTAENADTSPYLTVNQVDRFVCMKAKLSKGQPKLAKTLQLTTNDELTGLPERVLVKKLVRICAPIGADGGPTKHADRLVCFQVSPTKSRCADDAPLNPGAGCKKETDCGGVAKQTTLCTSQPKFAKRSGLYVTNDLDSGRLDAAKEDVLCLPSLPQP